MIRVYSSVPCFSFLGEGAHPWALNSALCAHYSGRYAVVLSPVRKQELIKHVRKSSASVWRKYYSNNGYIWAFNCGQNLTIP